VTTIANMAKKRGYSNEFPTDQSKRVKLEVDWVPPDLARKVKAKAKREGVSLRTLILRLLTEWLGRS
jgi:predicted HicB family RNase H-like nuclease